MTVQMLQHLKSQLHKKERAKYSTDLLGFLREVLDYRDVSPVPHGEIVEQLCDPNPYKMFLLPRGSFKTSIITIGYSMWRLTKDPDLRVLFDSKTIDKSRMFLSEVKYHIEHNQRFRELYGDWKYIPGFQEGSITIPQRTKAFKEATIDTGAVGSPQVGAHYDLIVADDLHDEKNIASEMERAKVILHFKTLFPILEPTGQLIVVGTRWHHADVYSWILENEHIERH